IVVAAALLNASKLSGEKLGDLRIVINGAGAAGVATARLLVSMGVNDVILCDRAGAIALDRQERMVPYKQSIAEITNKEQKTGSLVDVIQGADVFIGLSAPGTLSQDMVRSMAKNPFIFALANPTPEITPDLAAEAGAFAIATGRSDY